MKFKVLFIIFNVVIFASFALIFLMPAFVLGWEYTSVFWSTNWPVGLVFLLVLAALNAYFVYNWKVFSLLEQEDWESLVDHLEDQIFARKRVTRQRARILINACVVSGRMDRIAELERFLKEHRPRLVPALALELGIPHLLSNEASRMLDYYRDAKALPGVRHPGWIRWGYAFALMTDSSFDDARAELTAVLGESRDPLLRALTAHMLEPFGVHDEETARMVEEARSLLRTRSTRDRFDRELERQRQNLQVLFLASRIEQARDWVFGGPA
jgi:hypothetical protein